MSKRLGIWMWADLPLRHGAERASADCAFAGVTDIFFLTKGLNGRASCAPIGGVLGVADPDRDLLRELLDAAHARGIRVHAWLTSASDALYKAAHPESGLVHFTRGRDRDIVSIADEAYARYLEGFVAALVRQYPVDGLHLDYIRYNHAVYGWSEDDARRYADAGAEPEHLRRLMIRTFFADAPEPECLFDAYRAGDESATAFARVRRQNVLAFARRMTAAARAERPSLCVSAALMPEGAYADTAFSDVHYGQNYRDAAAMVDLALPMAYSQAYGQDAAWVAEVARGTAAYGLPVLVGVHAYEGGTGETLAKDMRAVSALDAPVEGAALFRAGTVAFARAEGKQLRVRNTLDAPITGFHAQESGAAVPLRFDAIPPGGEGMISLPDAPQDAPQSAPLDALQDAPLFLRAFSGEDEARVFVAP